MSKLISVLCFFFLFLISLFQFICSIDSHEVYGKKLFYMYELDEEYWWRWPKNGTEAACQENGYLNHDHAMNSAIGKVLIPEDGLFLTWHFSMFNSLYNRYKRSSRRTKDPEKASLFIIPYDLGLDGYLNPDTCKDRRSCSRNLVPKLVTMLENSTYFLRHQGADHAVLWSLGQYHPWPRERCDQFMQHFCAKCSFTSYWMDPTKAENRFISTPFPSAYHWWDGIKNLPWDLSLSNKRNFTAVYLGSTQTLNPYHTKIRRAMANQCNQSSECHWLRISHSSVDSTIADLLSVYKRSVFCLCPPGDDPARKAVFDSIVSGCIPVIFEVATLFNQYPWHIGEQAALDISVYIPGGLVKANKIDIMKVLLEIPPDVIRKKQIALAQVAPRVQYSIPPIELLKDKYDQTIWDPPFLDAAEITLDGLIERASHLLSNESTNIPHRLKTGREWGDEYSNVRIQIPESIVEFGFEVNFSQQRNKSAKSPHLSFDSSFSNVKKDSQSHSQHLNPRQPLSMHGSKANHTKHSIVHRMPSLDPPINDTVDLLGSIRHHPNHGKHHIKHHQQKALHQVKKQTQDTEDTA